MPAEAPLARRSSWGVTALLLTASALATIPVWIVTYPPMTDLPQHAAQVALLGNLAREDFPFTGLFEINWFTPYLLGYLLIHSLVPIMGVGLASKTIVALALGSLPLATALVMSETGTDRRWALLTIPALYGFTYQWGFLNFLVAAPLGLAFLALVMRHARRPTLLTYGALGPVFLLLFFSHAMICLFFGGIGGARLLFESGGWSKRLLRLAPMVAVAPVMIVWGLQTLENPLASRPLSWDLGWFSTSEEYYREGASWADSTGWGWGRAAGLLPRLLGVHPSLQYFIFGVLLFTFPLLVGARLRRKWVDWLPFGACLVTLFFVPGRVLGTDFTFQRFTVLLLPLYLVALEGPTSQRRKRQAWAAALVLVATWIVVASYRTRVYEEEAAGFAEILERMQPAESALSLVFSRDSRATIAPVFLHFPAWYAALQGGVVDPSFASTHVELVLYRAPTQPSARIFRFEWTPNKFDWNVWKGRRYRYFLVRAPQDYGQALFGDAPCTVWLRHHINHWWLYERDSACVATAVSR